MRFLLPVIAAGVLVAGAAADTSATRVVARIKVGPLAAPCAAAAGGKWIWVAEYGQPKLLKIDPRTNKVRSATKIGNGSCGLAYGAGSMWVEDTSSSTISRVSVRTGKRIAAIPVGATPYDSTFAFGSDWATAFNGFELDRIDPARNKVVARIALTTPVGVVGAFGSVWAAGQKGVIRVDPATNKVIATIDAPNAGWTAASDDAVWITSPAGLLRIDPATNKIAATVATPPVPLGDPSVVNGKVWVPVISQNRILVVDPATNTVVQSIRAGKGPFVVTAIGSEVWVPSWKGSDIWHFSSGS